MIYINQHSLNIGLLKPLFPLPLLRIFNPNWMLLAIYLSPPQQVIIKFQIHYNKSWRLCKCWDSHKAIAWNYNIWTAKVQTIIRQQQKGSSGCSSYFRKACPKFCNLDLIILMFGKLLIWNPWQHSTRLINTHPHWPNLEYFRDGDRSDVFNKNW